MFDVVIRKLPFTSARDRSPHLLVERLSPFVRPIVDRIALFIHKIKRRGHQSDTWVVSEDLETIGETFRMVGVIGVQDGDKLAPGPIDRGVQCAPWLG